MSPNKPSVRCELRSLGSHRSLLSFAQGKHYKIDAPADRVENYLNRISHGDAKDETATLRSLLAKNAALAETDICITAEDVVIKQPASADDVSNLPHDLAWLIVGEESLAPLLRDALVEQSAIASWVNLPLIQAGYVALNKVTVVLVTDRRLSESTLAECSTLNDLGVSWLLVELHSQGITVGPQTRNGKGASALDAYYREAAVSFDHEVHAALQSSPLWGSNQPTVATQEALMGRVSKELSAGLPEETIVELAIDGERTVHRVLPRPGYLPAAKHDWRSLIDPRYGVIKRIRDVEHHETIPESVTTVQADVSNMRHVGPYSNSVFCQGSSLQDRKSAYLAALGESVERYCANILSEHPRVHSSYDALIRRGFKALAPEEVVLFSENQYASEGFPFTKFDRDLPITWSLGYCHTTMQEIWVPSSLVYVNWHTGMNKPQPLINFAPFAGVAAGDSVDMAVVNGVQEVIERHATMVWWLNGHSLPCTEAESYIDEFFGTLKTQHAPQLICLDNVFDLPVAAGIVFDDEEHLTHIGFSCKNTLRDAAIKAWTEALTLQEGARDLLNPDGAHWRALTKGLLAGRSYKKWRADRRYLDDFRDDFRDVDDLMVQQEVYLDPRAGERMAHLLRPTATTQERSSTKSQMNNLSDCVEVLDQANMRLITVDITTTDVGCAGLTVQRSIVPGTVGNSPAAFPYLGGRVVQDQAVSLGWVESALPESQLNYFPMPHA